MAEILSTGKPGQPEHVRQPHEQFAQQPGEREVLFVDTEERRRRWYYRMRIAFSEFLGIPVAIALGLILLGWLLYLLERVSPVWSQPTRALVMRYFFQTSEATRSTLDMVGASGLTTASIIITLLLLVLQQTAGNMGNMIYDQFLQRRTNQIYVGLVIGVTAMALSLGVTVSESFNPVLGAAVVVILVIALVFLLLFLLYFTIEQMRPEEIINRIHQRTLTARTEQIRIMRRTRNEPELKDATVVEARSQAHGYVVDIHLDLLGECIRTLDSEAELVITSKIGTYVHYGECLAEAHARRRADARRLAGCVGQAFRLATMREMAHDPAFGLEQLEMMAWTEISSAKHNPETGMLVIYSLRDLLSRWAKENSDPEENPLPIVYPDRLPPGVIDTLESLAGVAADGKQHQNMIEILMTVERLLDDLPPDLQRRAEEMILRIMPTFKQFVLTHHLNAAMHALLARLETAGRQKTAAALRRTILEMEKDIQPG